MSHRASFALATGLSLALLSGAASASLATFFEDNTAANATGLPGQSFLVDQDVKDKIAAFNSPLTSLSTYEFEGATPFAATTGAGGTMTVAGAQRLCGTGQPCPVSYQGRFNTTGLASSGTTADGKWLETNSTTQTSSFSMSFGTAINAIGFFGTDFYDFAGQVTYEIFDANGNEVEDVGLGRSIPIRDGINGALLFFGLHSSTTFNKITFTVVQTSTDQDSFDYLGFDSIITGKLSVTQPPGVPEPGSIALSGLALLGLSLTRRNRRKS